VASAASVCSRFAFDFVFSVSPWLCGECSFGCGYAALGPIVANNYFAVLAVYLIVNCCPDAISLMMSSSAVVQIVPSL